MHHNRLPVTPHTRPRLGPALALALAAACTPGRSQPGGGDPDGGAPADLAVIAPIRKDVIGPGAPPDAPGRFGTGEDPARAPKLLYPADGTVVPANLNELELQFDPGPGNQLFELSFKDAGARTDLRIYLGCTPLGSGGSACAFTPDDATWKLISDQGRGRTLTVGLRGTAAGGGVFGAAPPRALGFSAEDIKGGLYYWAAKSGGIYRYDFGLRGQQAESFYTPGQAGGGTQCVGCHALSRNGARIAVGLNAPTPAATMRVLEVSSRKQLYQLGSGGFSGGSNYQALSPDGARLVTVESSGLTLRATDGTLLSANPAVQNANMPDWSADGAKIVFARGSGSCQFGICDTLNVQNAGIYSVPVVGNGFGGATTIVPPSSGNNYYPSLSPDGTWVVYNHSSMASYDATDAAVFAAWAAGGRAAIELKAVNAGGAASWPKAAPWIHHSDGHTLFWVTFSSRRPVGERGGGTSQIWMAAVDVDDLAAGRDGGRPAFWLPFQDPATGNHIAQWVEKVDRAPCTQIDTSGCMAGEQCIDGYCQPRIQ